MRKQATVTKTTTATPKTDEYNGWSNYETWCVALWISDNPGTDEYARELVANAYDRAEQETRDDPHAITAPRSDAADAFREWIASEDPLADRPSLYSDLLTHALGRADWHKIANAFRDSDGGGLSR